MLIQYKNPIDIQTLTQHALQNKKGGCFSAQHACFALQHYQTVKVQFCQKSVLNQTTTKLMSTLVHFHLASFSMKPKTFSVLVWTVPSEFLQS